MNTPLSLPFGKHRDEPFEQVPTSYLTYLLRGKLSASIRTAVAAELQRRGIPVPDPAPAPPRPVPSCQRCRDKGETDAGFSCSWDEDAGGHRRVRASCARCGRFLTYLPSQPPYTDQADAMGSGTDLLDVLTELEERGVELHSDGRRTWVDWPECQRLPLRLQALLRSCSHQLALLLGRPGRAATR